MSKLINIGDNAESRKEAIINVTQQTVSGIIDIISYSIYDKPFTYLTGIERTEVKLQTVSFFERCKTVTINK